MANSPAYGLSNYALTVQSTTDNLLVYSNTTTGNTEFSVDGTGNVVIAGNVWSTGASTSYLGGSVGIGTTLPVGKLHVESAGTNYIYTRNSAAAGIAGVIFQNTTDTRSWRISGTDFQAYDNSAGAARMTINSTGNVGIATSSPSATLHVVGPGTAAGSSGFIARFVDASGRDSATINGGIDGNTPATNGTLNLGGGAQLSYSLTSTHGVNLATTFSGLTSPGMLVQGYVGIGTTSASGRLTVRGDTGDNATIDIKNNATNIWKLWNDNGASSLNFQYNGSTRMMVTAAGNLLMATTSLTLPATAELWFNGQVQQGLNIKNTAANQSGAAIRFIDSTGAFSGGGIYYTVSSSVSYSASSDARLKSNVSALDGSLSIINGLNPVKFNWTADGSAGEGFLAHELQQLVPLAVIGETNAVDADGNPRYQVADYSKIIPRLVAAIQELKSEFDAYKESHP